MTLTEDIRKLADDIERNSQLAEQTAVVVTRHEEQISGDRGISATLQDLTNEVKSLRRAMYWVAGIIITGSIGFAFTTLQLVGH